MTERHVLLVDLGQMRYGAAWAWQRRAAKAVADHILSEVVFLVEHPPVYTIGRSARGSRDHLLWSDAERNARGIELFEVDRGGDITYHGPGQAVVYPILDLNREGRDLHGYLRRLEEAIIAAVGAFGIAADRLPPHTGVWVGDEKIAAIGVKASRWVTQHGLALNVDPDLDHFSGIVPCGIQDKGVTSMARILGTPLAVADVAPQLIAEVARVFALDLEPEPLEALADQLPMAAG